MDRPLISVVLPTYNREKYIKRAMDSVLRQTYENVELIIVDDKSTDNTIAVASAYRDERVKLIRHRENLGCSAARNTGIDAARGEYIAFQDSDDVWLPHKLEKQLRLLRSSPCSKFCFGSFIRFDSGRARALACLSETDVDQFNHLILKENLVTTQTIFAEAAFIKQCGKFDVELPRYIDWEQALRLSELTRFTYDPEPLVLVFRTAGSLSSNILNDSVARRRLAVKHFDKFIRHKPYLASNYAEAGYTAVVGGQVGVGLDCFFLALRYAPFSNRVWARIGKALFRSIVTRH
jgi:glycosyltransferase involved in cell wall biosynthesis